MIYLIIYLTGYVLALFSAILCTLYYDKNDLTYESLFWATIASLFSWVFFIFILDYCEIISPKKLPKKVLIRAKK